MRTAWIAAALGAGLLLAACPNESETTRLQTAAALHRIDQHVDAANESALANDFFESLKEAQFGQALARQLYGEKKNILDLAREQELKGDPKQRIDMSRYDIPTVKQDYAKAREHVAYFKEKIPFTFLRMVDSLAAEDAELRAKARRSFEAFCAYEHPAFSEFRRELLVENKLRMEKTAYANAGDVSRMIYDCFARDGV